MSEEELKEKIKNLQEKLAKKNCRMKELSSQLKKSKEKEDEWYNLYDRCSDWKGMICQYFPNKYYKVEWSGVNDKMMRNTPIIELKEGICVEEVIFNLKTTYKLVEIHMIQEVA